MEHYLSLSRAINGNSADSDRERKAVEARLHAEKLALWQKVVEIQTQSHTPALTSSSA